jgi:hypothetical protein
MAERVDLPEDFLRIGEPAANRQSVLSAILDAVRSDDTIRGVGATSAPLTEEARTAALTTRLELPPEEVSRPARVKGPFPTKVIPEESTLTGVRRGGEEGGGFYEWTDEKGVRHATNKPETAPANATFKPFEEPVAVGVGGSKLFGELTPETAKALARADETDQQREDRIVGEIAKESGKGLGEARRAFRESRADISGKPISGIPETFEEKTALRNKIVQNTQRLLKQNPEARNEILKQAGQLMRLRGVSEIKKAEQTITTEIEGQTVEIPVAKYDPKKHGKGASRGDVSTVVTNFESVTGTDPATRGTNEYKKDFFNWRESLSGTKVKSIDDQIFDVYLKVLKSDPDLANDPLEWKEIEDGIRAQGKRLKPAATARGVGGRPVVSPPPGGRKPLSDFGS